MTTRHAPGLLLGLAGALLALALHHLLPAIGTLTWSLVLGVVVANTGALPPALSPGLALCSRTVLRFGVMLLGFGLSLTTVAALGWPVLAVVVGTLAATLLLTMLLGRRLGMGGPRRLVLAAGFAICGASAIGAVEDTAGADDEDVAAAVAMVTLFGTLAMVTMPLLQRPLGLDQHQFGVWAGASVREVGQVLAAAEPIGATALSVAAVVKLTRVLMLAPVTAGLRLSRRTTSGRRPAPVPAFVVGFLGLAVLSTVVALPASLTTPVATLRDLALGAGLFALGTGVHLARLASGSRATVLTATGSAVLVTALGLAGALAVG